MKPTTQYESILTALRRAGRKGCTIRDLLAYSNCPWKRIEELENRYFDGFWDRRTVGQVTETERIVFDEKLVNGRKLRVYRLEKIK